MEVVSWPSPKHMLLHVTWRDNNGQENEHVIKNANLSPYQEPTSPTMHCVPLQLVYRSSPAQCLLDLVVLLTSALRDPLSTCLVRAITSVPQLVTFSVSNPFTEWPNRAWASIVLPAGDAAILLILPSQTCLCLMLNKCSDGERKGAKQMRTHIGADPCWSLFPGISRTPSSEGAVFYKQLMYVMSPYKRSS